MDRFETVWSPPISIFSINIMTRRTPWLILAVGLWVHKCHCKAVGKLCFEGLEPVTLSQAQGDCRLPIVHEISPQIVRCLCPCLCLILSHSAYSVMISCCGRSDVFPGTLSCSLFPECWEEVSETSGSALSWFPSSNTPTLFFGSQCADVLLKKKKSFPQISEACALTAYICFYFIFLLALFPRATIRECVSLSEKQSSSLNDNLKHHFFIIKLWLSFIISNSTETVYLELLLSARLC